MYLPMCHVSTNVLTNMCFMYLPMYTNVFTNVSSCRGLISGYRDMSIPWMIYEMDDPHLNVTALRIWQKVRPLYEELHAYVRHNLVKRYPGKLSEDGPIPEHLLGEI